MKPTFLIFVSRPIKLSPNQPTKPKQITNRQTNQDLYVSSYVDDGDIHTHTHASILITFFLLIIIINILKCIEECVFVLYLFVLYKEIVS